MLAFVTVRTFSTVEEGSACLNLVYLSALKGSSSPESIGWKLSEISLKALFMIFFIAPRSPLSHDDFWQDGIGNHDDDA